MLSLGQLYTDDDTNDNNDNNDDTNDNDTRRTNHDCIGSLACMPNEPKKESLTEGLINGTLGILKTLISFVAFCYVHGKFCAN